VTPKVSIQELMMRVDAVLRCREEDGKIEKVRREWQSERCVFCSIPLRVCVCVCVGVVSVC
jgi:hypothetical protein